MHILPKTYYCDNDVLFLARDLIGKVLVSNSDGVQSSGIIVETEAYKAPEDKASHAYNNRFTHRTKTMFEQGGIAYIYLVYGFHHMFNVVTGPAGTPHAILIRAVEPFDNTGIMLDRRGFATTEPDLTNGPGKLTQALGISTKLNGVDLASPDSPIQIWENGFIYSDIDVIASPRVGIDFAEEYIMKPWRFRLKTNQWAGK